jgi:hypothetical protein
MLGLTLHVQPICPLPGLVRRIGSNLVAKSADFAGFTDFSGF